MKKILISFLFMAVILVYSCSTGNKLRMSNYDATSALKEMLSLGVRQGVSTTFNQQNILSIFPEPIRKPLITVQQLGLSPDLDRFTVTMAQASQISAERSMPIFLTAIDHMSFSDAMHIIKSGGTSGTDYMRSATGAELRLALRPVMQNALEEYHINETWNKIINNHLGGRINLDLPNLMAGMVSEKMFQKMAETEIQIRHDQRARTSQLLRKAFSGNYY